MSGCPQEADRWSSHGSRAVTWAGSFVAPPLCLFFFSVANIFWNPDLRRIYLSLSHRCFVSLHFLRYLYGLTQIRTYPHFSVRFIACFVAFELCVFLYILDTNPYWTWRLPISSPFHTSFLILLIVLHGKAFKFDVHSLVHFSFHIFSFWNYSQISLPSLMYRSKVPLPF